MENCFEEFACFNCDNNIGDGCAVDNEAYNDISSEDCPDFIPIQNDQNEEEESTEVNLNSVCFVCDRNYGDRCALFNPLYNKVRFPDECPDFAHTPECDEDQNEFSPTDDIDEDSIDDINDQNDRLDHLNNH